MKASLIIALALTAFAQSSLANNTCAHVLSTTLIDSPYMSDNLRYFVKQNLTKTQSNWPAYAKVTLSNINTFCRRN